MEQPYNAATRSSLVETEAASKAGQVFDPFSEMQSCAKATGSENASTATAHPDFMFAVLAITLLLRRLVLVVGCSHVVFMKALAY